MASDDAPSPVVTFLSDRLRFLVGVGEYLSLTASALSAFFRRPLQLNLILKQLYQIGVTSLPVVATTGLFTGLVLAAQSFYQLSDKGLATITGLMVGKAMMTELGPVLTAFMVTGRVGAAMCAELGTMRVTEQIDALETMAVSPIRYLVTPRVIAGTLVMPFLTLFGVMMGIFGGYLISIFYFGMAPANYFDPMPRHISLFDLTTAIVKAVVFGLIIMSISCYKGMKTRGGAAGVGQATTNSVVTAYCCILFVNFLLTIGLNIIRSHIARLLV
jgi:phospholipid/cholesterol/gamma-HCH transport system permease protein